MKMPLEYTRNSTLGEMRRTQLMIGLAAALTAIPCFSILTYCKARSTGWENDKIRLLNPYKDQLPVTAYQKNTAVRDDLMLQIWRLKYESIPP